MSNTPKNIVILGSTGSIGESALRVVAAFPDRFRIIGLAAQTKVERLLEQARLFSVERVAVADCEAARRATQLAPAGLAVLAGPEGLEELAVQEAADIVLVAVVGMAGLSPVLAALCRGTDVALATKEVLVAAGQKVIAASRASGARILPVDSEHSAIFQCLGNQGADRVRRLMLTASGGPFAHNPRLDLEKVTVAEALKHPRWNMGRKVTVDSATMMNKGLEIIEAHWLFGVPFDRIEVVIHPESIVHSMVEFQDGNVLAQLSVSDMRFAIQLALTWPERLDGGLPALDLARLGTLHFSVPDEARFPCLRLARAAARVGGSMPVILNAANEVAVQEFLNNKLSFPGIWRTVEQVLGRHTALADPDLPDILAADRWAREEAGRLIWKK
ncbi:MAG: 1-deoxy-D-xylulose-5-phosphate reductoisomerase [Verrucomicrobia bacterium]|nr:1-deoxy-D-xylulose-5-phosphate reductoisomerase [Verrucomicrobiota bacterium]